jgi:hypothetical protein
MRAIAWSAFPASNAPMTAYRNSMIESSAPAERSTGSEGITSAKFRIPAATPVPVSNRFAGKIAFGYRSRKREKSIRARVYPLQPG